MMLLKRRKLHSGHGSKPIKQTCLAIPKKSCASLVRGALSSEELCLACSPPCQQILVLHDEIQKELQETER